MTRRKLFALLLAPLACIPGNPRRKRRPPAEVKEGWSINWTVTEDGVVRTVRSDTMRFDDFLQSHWDLKEREKRCPPG